MSGEAIDKLARQLRAGELVPYLGPGVLYDVKNKESGEPMPAMGKDLILAMNKGRPMAPKLMYEFPRAAMNLELKRGRRFIEQFFTRLYGETQYTRAALHDFIKSLRPKLTIDINRDTQLQDSFSDTPHLLIRGIARVGGTDYRFVLSQFDGEKYTDVTLEEADSSLPLLFKPMGSPLPSPTYIASDADYVDYITELMGGFGLPSFLKDYRVGRQYLFLGMRFNRDTERMVMSDIALNAAEPMGWALIREPNDKERRFCDRKGIHIVEADVADFLQAATVAAG